MKDIIEELLAAAKRAEEELGLDWRTSWSRMSMESPDAVKLELSRREVLERISAGAATLGAVTAGEDGLSIGTPDGGLARVVLAGAGRLLCVVSSVADLRRQPEHGSELISQAIMGETLAELERQGDWSFVKMEDEYHGWVRSWYVTETDERRVGDFSSRADARVEASVAYVLSSPDPSSIPVTDVTAGTWVVTQGKAGSYVEVTLPGGKSGFLLGDALASPAASDDLRTRILERARHFAGVTYVWGGTSGKGFDCSGLIKRVFLMEGIGLPRDADLQSRVGERIEAGGLDAVRPADLLFFGENGRITHVAIAMGEGRFIHSFGDVRVNSYVEDDPLFEGKLAGKLLFATDVIDG